MTELRPSGGVVHDLPDDLAAMLGSDPAALEAWEDITPLARNEWICWVTSVKKAETRSRHIERASSDLKAGKRRPCCWPGCPHRPKTGKV
ncbi:YdeI/OmpD-associated family protein [Brevundimonas sp.]|uniref:YdeI/OmpD-associated family protein n=1 Tax=Brevundimonas sp. TaxID=1871086 RepID=UPI002AB9D05F|nr:YdeI/OmpD-associated family protein [Brevundimonas sp.]MDZ4364209.1 YdeI/OmpD-associated family protein [Brevundimonas sp.]